MNSYGEIQIFKRPCEIQVGALWQKRAQIVVPTTAIRDINKIQLKLEQKIQLKEGRYAGCIIVPGGRMVFALFNKDQVSVHRNDGHSQHSTSIDVGRYPYDLAVINNNTVAVSCRDSRSINIVNIDKGVVSQNIDVGGRCHGLSYYNDKLYVLVQNKEIHSFNLDGKFVKKSRFTFLQKMVT